ncbi:unnamed protein product [Macrosiphum euphorbiae]|uniref:Uncharacterized protein n=1 Tax=Macrosiphum euphorbiae TaxID=13131 RepID=A0AAV0Y149_9HEMI|nr:unnamed protein product [Macrosiphum euphorbiae]
MIKKTLNPQLVKGEYLARRSVKRVYEDPVEDQATFHSSLFWQPSLRYAALPQCDFYIMHTRGNHMENLKKPNRLDTMDKTNASENSNNGEYGKLKYKYDIRNTLEKAGSSISTEKVNFSRSYDLQYFQHNFSSKYVDVHCVCTMQT